MNILKSYADGQAVGTAVCADGIFRCPDRLLPRRPDADGHRRQRVVPTARAIVPTAGGRRHLACLL